MNRYLTHFLNGVLFLSVLYFSYSIIHYSSRGLDITDESYYILRAAHAGLYSSDLTNYGFFTGLLYQLANDSITGFRILGFLFLFSTAFFASFQFLHFLSRGTHSHTRKIVRVVYLSFILSCGIFSYYFLAWLITPSYNWLILFGSLLTISGVFWFLSDVRPIRSLKSQVLPGLLIGMGSFLMANANPLAALTLSFISYFIILIFGTSLKNRFSILLIILPVVLLLYLPYIYWISGSLSVYVENVRSGLELSSLLGSGHSPGSVLRRTFVSVFELANPIHFIRHSYLYIVLLFSALIAFRFVPKLQTDRKELYLNALLLLIFILYLFNNFDNRRLYGLDTIYLIYLLLISFYFKEVLFYRENAKRIISNSWIPLLTVLSLILIGFFLRFGTNNDLISASFAGAYYYFLAMFILCHLLYKHNQKFADYVALFLIVSILLQVHLRGLESPYRLPAPIVDQIHEINIIGSSSSLWVDPHTFTWATTLQQNAQSEGWRSGNYLIDFTGGTPGATVILGAVAPGRAWLIGSYPGSDTYAFRTLSLIERGVLESSWILTAPDGDRKLSDDLLHKLGINLKEDYRQVADVRSGYRNEHQVLWKPKE